MIKYVLILLIVTTNLTAQVLTPLEKSNYKKLTSNAELVAFINQIASESKIIKVDTLTYSPLGKMIPIIRISDSSVGDSNNKIKVLIFAQQHGNEHSGKEASLLLLKKFVEGQINFLLKNMDLFLIPQLNSDGNDKNERRNGNSVDLNRNHLLLTEPETVALHQLFNSLLPEVTLDIHEYTPFGKDWIEFGYRKNYDVQFGLLTNPNIYPPIINFQKKNFMQYMEKYLYYAGVSFNEYIVGGPPNKSRLRYSTVDINDGRQSFGIQNTLSFIFEGINGKEPIDNIQYRAEAQLNAILGLLNFVNDNFSSIKKLVKDGRESLISDTSAKLSIQMEHYGESKKEIKLLSLKTNKDTVLSISNFHDKVKSILDIEKPFGYLIPKTEEDLVALLKKHNVNMKNYIRNSSDKVFQYYITDITIKNLEELDVKIPSVIKKEIDQFDENSYLFVPINQIKAHVLVLMLEPESMINILQQEKFAYLLKANSNYPILRLEKN